MVASISLSCSSDTARKSKSFSGGVGELFKYFRWEHNTSSNTNLKAKVLQIHLENLRFLFRQSEHDWTNQQIEANEAVNTCGPLFR